MLELCFVCVLFPPCFTSFSYLDKHQREDFFFFCGMKPLRDSNEITNTSLPHVDGIPSLPLKTMTVLNHNNDLAEDNPRSPKR